MNLNEIMTESLEEAVWASKLGQHDLAASFRRLAGEALLAQELRDECVREAIAYTLEDTLLELCDGLNAHLDQY